MVRMVVVEGAAEKKKAEKDKNRGERLLFLSTLESIFFFLRTCNLLLFIGVEEGNLVFTGEKVLALDLTRRIQTVGSKYVP